MNNDLFFIIICLLISKKINENNFIYLLKIFIESKIFNILDIIELDNIFLCLEEFNFSNSYNFLLSLYLISDIEKNFYTILDNYEQLRNEFEKNNKDIKCINEFLNNKLLIINSFLKIDTFIITNNSKINLIYISNYKEDIINRLFYFRNHFDIDIIKFIGIELIEYKNILKLKVNDLIEHYKNLVNTFNKKFKKWITLFEVYEKTLNNYNSKLNLILENNLLLKYNINTAEFFTNH